MHLCDEDFENGCAVAQANADTETPAVPREEMPEHFTGTQP